MQALIRQLRARLEGAAGDPWDYPDQPLRQEGLALPEAFARALGEDLRLSADEVALLGCVYALSLDRVLARASAEVMGFNRPCGLTCDVACHIFQTSPLGIERRFRTLLSEAGVPARMGLVTCEGAELKPTTSLRSLLAGRAELPHVWQPFAQLRRGAPAAPLVCEATQVEAVAMMEQAWSSDDPAPLTYMIGPSGVGKALLAQQLAHRRGLSLLCLDGRALPSALHPLEVVREAKWLRAAILLRVSDGPNDAASLARWLPALTTWLDYDLDVCVSLPQPQPLPTFAHRQTLWLPFERPSPQALRALWQRYLPARLRDAGLTDDRLAFLFRGAGRDVAHMASLAMDLASARDADAPRVSVQDLDTVATQTMTGKLTQLGSLEPPLPEGLDAVVLAPTQRQALEEIIARVHHRQQVMDQWGFAARLNQRGVGTIALLSGPPGTGKTLSARAVASALGLRLYRVDLSQVVSKWVGETEKHLGALFDDAEASGVALLFDEADALFARRTEVKSSNDRYANLEVGFLLQRLEALTSVCFLTTNLLDSIDDAFLRRLSVHIAFKLPDEVERRALWARSLPREAPGEGEVDAAWLAQQFGEMSGGLIRNAALRAAFIAAAQRAPIQQEVLAACAREEQARGGALVRHAQPSSPARKA
jgi:hypothetical protein